MAKSKARTDKIKPLGLPPSWAIYKQPFKKRGNWNYRLLNESEQEIIVRRFPDSRHVMDDLFALLVTEFKMTPSDCEGLTWGEILAVLSRSNPIGYLSITDIRRQFNLDEKGIGRLKKRLSRWREQNPDLCRRESDTGTGREQYTYPADIVHKLLNE